MAGKRKIRSQFNDYSTNFGSEFPFLPHLIIHRFHASRCLSKRGKNALSCAKNSQEAKGILFLTRDNIHSTYPTKLAYGRENEKELWQRKCNRDVKKEGCELTTFLQSPAVL